MKKLPNPEDVQYFVKELKDCQDIGITELGYSDKKWDIEAVREALRAVDVPTLTQIDFPHYTFTKYEIDCLQKRPHDNLKHPSIDCLSRRRPILSVKQIE